MSTEQRTVSASTEPGCDGDYKAHGNLISRTHSEEHATDLKVGFISSPEPKAHKDQDVENETKIQHLLQDKFELGKKLDIETAKLANKDEQHEMELRETRRQMEDKIREVKIDSSQQQVARKIAEKESEGLKEEIRKLQLTNYALQKQIRDHERHEKVQTSEREQHIRQISQLENQFKQVTSLTKEVGTKQMKLENDSLRKKDGSEYEPDTLTSIQNSIDRHIKSLKLQHCIKTDAAFSHSRRVLESKRKSLKAMGKGNKSAKAEALSEEEIKILYEKNVLGTGSPESLLHTVWVNNGVYFGLRGRQDHTNLLWGDIKLKQTSDGKEFLEFTVKEIDHLNHILRYQNLHNKCIVKLKDRDITQLQDQIVSSAVIEKTLLRGDKEREKQLTREITLLKEKLSNGQKQFDTLSKDAEAWKTKYWDSLKTLEEAHRLVSVNLHNSAQYKKELETSEEVNKATVEKLELTGVELREVRGQLENATEGRERAEGEWRKTKSELEDKIQNLNADLSSEREKYTNLEAVNTQTNNSVEELKTELENLKAVLNRERCEFSTQTELSLLSVADENIQTCSETTNKDIQTDEKEIACCYVQTINPALYSSEAQTDQAVLAETGAQTDPSVVTQTGVQTDQREVIQTGAQTDTVHMVSTVAQTVVLLEDETINEGPEPSRNIPDTVIPPAVTVQQFTQTEPADTDSSHNVIQSVEVTGNKDEALLITESQIREDSRDNEVKTSIDQVSSVPLSGSKEVAESDEDQKVARGVEAIDPKRLNVNVGICARDMNIRPTGDLVSGHVMVDPEDYALTLTQEQPIIGQNAEECDAEVTDSMIGQDNSDGDVTRNMIGQESKTDYEIGDSDDDDFVAPTQMSRKSLDISRDKEFETVPLKHRLSLSERLKQSFGNRGLLNSTEKEIECSPPKQIKYSDIDSENYEYDTGYTLTAYIDADKNENLDPISLPTEMNRIVARSGQKLDSAVAATFGSKEKLGEASEKSLKSEKSFKERNQPCRVLRTEKDRIDSSHPSPFNSHSKATNKQNHGKLRLHHYETPDIPRLSDMPVAEPLTKDTFCGTGLNVSKSLSTSKAVNPRYPVSQPTKSYSSTMTMDISVKPVSSSLSSTASGSATNKTGSGISSPSSLPDAPIITSSDSVTSVSRSAASSSEMISTTYSIPVSTRPQSSTASAASGDSEPSFLQKYREIVAKIKPVAALQPQAPKKPGTSKKGKHLYTGSHTAMTMLPTPQDATTEDDADQLSADSLNTRHSLRGILKGSVGKERGNKNVSWNS